VAVGNSGDIPFAHRDGSLDIGLMSRNYGVVPDAFGTVSQDFPPNGNKGGDWGAMGWADPAVTRALAALPSTPADADGGQLRGRLRRQIAATLQRDLPLIPVVWYRQTLAASPRLGGVSIDPFERSYRLTQMHWHS